MKLIIQENYKAQVTLFGLEALDLSPQWGRSIQYGFASAKDYAAAFSMKIRSFCGLIIWFMCIYFYNILNFVFLQLFNHFLVWLSVYVRLMSSSPCVCYFNYLYSWFSSWSLRNTTLFCPWNVTVVCIKTVCSVSQLQRIIQFVEQSSLFFIWNQAPSCISLFWSICWY